MRSQKNLPEQLKLADFADKSLLILDDDDPLRGRLARAMEKKGFQVKEAKTVAEGLSIVKSTPPSFACVDLRLEDGNGLDVVKELSKNKKESRIVMLTGYGNLPTAVAAVKAGAIDYIAKPVDIEWNYTVGNVGQYLYNSVTSVDFDLSVSEQTNVIIQILAYAGVIINDPTIIQVAQTEQQLEQQTQNS